MELPEVTISFRVRFATNIMELDSPDIRVVVCFGAVVAIAKIVADSTQVGLSKAGFKRELIDFATSAKLKFEKAQTRRQFHQYQNCLRSLLEFEWRGFQATPNQSTKARDFAAIHILTIVSDAKTNSTGELKRLSRN